jgi:hypothetical protein
LSILTKCFTFVVHSVDNTSEASLEAREGSFDGSDDDWYFLVFMFL